MEKKGGRVVARWLVLVLLLLPVVAAALTPAGTLITHSFSVRFANPSQPQLVSSNQTQVTIGDLAAPALVPPRSALGAAGQPVDFLHTITNRGNAPDTFQLKAALLRGALPQSVPAPAVQFFSADGKSPLPVDASGQQTIGPLAAGASLDLVLRVTPPAGSEGTVENLTVSATSTAFPARTASLADQLSIPAPGLAPLVLAVTPEGAVLSGTVLTYSIALANSGALPVSGVRIADPLSPLLQYQQGSAQFPAGLSGSVSYDGGSRTLGFLIPSLPAGFNGTITFQARVVSDAPAGSPIPNRASITSDLSATPGNSNSTLNSVFAGDLRVSRVGRCTLQQLLEPPGLKVNFPPESAAVGPFTISGESEPGLRVFVDGVEVVSASPGKFQQVVRLRPGVNLIRVEALDPTGNASYASRIVYGRPPPLPPRGSPLLRLPPRPEGEVGEEPPGGKRSVAQRLVGQEEASMHKKLKFPLRFKILVSQLLVVSVVLSLITFTMANLFHVDKTAYIHDLTSTVVLHTAAEANSLMQGYRERLRLFSRVMSEEESAGGGRVLQGLFEEFPEFVMVTRQSGGGEETVYDAAGLAAGGGSKEELLRFRQSHPLPALAAGGEP